MSRSSFIERTPPAAARERELLTLIKGACQNQAVVFGDTTFSTSDVNEAAVKKICEKFGFDSLEYQSLDGVLESIGIDKDKVCTYCWSGKE